ncbi:MAG: hypothetical protein QOF85_2229 [Solirubrobacterales bacterium]|jgi:hypothetical protein|nr:hypothetical protein [Solirubrobacterales bacterium]
MSLARRRPRHVLAPLLTVSFVVALAVIAAPGARAEASAFGIDALSASFSESQAGGHPDVTTSIALNKDALGNSVQQMKDLEVELPTGFVGNPQATPQCTPSQLRAAKCPLDSQVGVIEPFFVIVCPGVATTLGNEGITTAPPTVLSEAASDASSMLVVASTAGIVGGDLLTVGQPGETVHVTVSSVIDATHLQLPYAIGTALPAGTPVGDDVIHVADTAHFCAGEENEITIGSGADEEVGKIAFVLSGNRLALEAPLQNPHALGEPVTHMAEERTAPFPIYNVEPSRGHLATLGASILIGSIIMQLDAREDDSGIDATISNMSTLLGMNGAKIALWGVPAATSHDSQRCTLLGHECQASTAEARAFISAPGQCGEPLTTMVHVDSWQEPERSVTASTAQPAPTGCDQLQFAPTLSVTPDTTKPDSPTGYEVDLKLPRNADPLAPETPPLTSLAVTLPPGVSLSPAGAAGLGVCNRSQFDTGSCPAGASVGSVSVSSPALAAPLPGKVYLATPQPDVPWGIFLIAGNEAIAVRLAGRLELNPATGQVTIAFRSLPQLPLSEIKVSFPGGQTASLDNPAACGTATTTSRLIAASGQVATPGSSFLVAGATGACSVPRSFAPRFSAGMTTRHAGAASAFVINVSREDGEGDLSTVGAKLPPGLLGDFSGVTPCQEPAASRGDCPAAAKIGATQVVAGAGNQPLTLPGTVYLTGPYGGAPYGLSIVVPAVAGPFNLGMIVTRGSVTVDPRTLRVSIATDPLPRVFGGVPVRVRAVHLNLDRPGFTFNPTNCAPGSIDATIDSVEGAASSSSALFTVSGCAGLHFTPRLSAAVGPGASRSGAGLSLVLRVGSGSQANLSSLAVRLPRQLHPRLDAIRQACPAKVYDAAPDRCPAASALSRMVISSPLFGSGLTGTGYLVARGGKALPVVATSFKVGDATLTMEGHVRLTGDGVATLVFPDLPDIPLQTLRITLPRSKNSVLGATGRLCSGPRPNVGFRAEAQNGARLTRTVAVSVAGCGGAGGSDRATRRSLRRPPRGLPSVRASGAVGAAPTSSSGRAAPSARGPAGSG